MSIIKQTSYHGYRVDVIDDVSHNAFAGLSTDHETVITIAQNLYDSCHRDAVLAHELGHIELGHVDKVYEMIQKYGIGYFEIMQAMRRCGADFARKHEIDADRYACRKVGYRKVLAMLEYLPGTDEVRARIEAINKRFQ